MEETRVELERERNSANDEGRDLNDQEEDPMNIAGADRDVEEFEDEEEEEEGGDREEGRLRRDGQGGEAEAEAEDDTETDMETAFRPAGDIPDDEDDGQDSE
jgi:hypothetical protein